MEKWYNKVYSVLFGKNGDGKKKKRPTQHHVSRDQHRIEMRERREQHEREMRESQERHEQEMKLIKGRHEGATQNTKGAQQKSEYSTPCAAPQTNKKKYYVNTIYDNNVPGLAPLDPKFKYVGMFSECDIKETKPVLWDRYADTRYLNTIMHAVAVYENEGYYCSERGYYRHFGQLGTFVYKQPVEVNMYFDEIRIMHCKDTDVIEADSLEEAIEMFKNKKWRPYRLDKDKAPICDKNDKWLLRQQEEIEREKHLPGGKRKQEIREKVAKKYNPAPYTSPWAVDELIGIEFDIERLAEQGKERY